MSAVAVLWHVGVDDELEKIVKPLLRQCRNHPEIEHIALFTIQTIVTTHPVEII